MMIRRTVRALLALVLFASASLALDGGGRASAVVPGRDGKIAFTRTDQIYTIHGDGTGLRQLTDPASGKNSWPKWGPNGRRIAYVNEPSPGVRDLWIMNADGSEKVQVTTTGDVADYGPAWSPNGRWLAFVRLDERPLHRVRATAPFGDPTPIWGASQPSYGEYASGTPSWSATGNWIAMLVEGPTAGYWMQMFNPETKETRIFASTDSGSCGYVDSPAFSADGTLVRYTWAGCFDEPAIQTYRVRDGQYIGGFTSDPDDDQIAFAPSGTRVALVNYASGWRQPMIYIAKFDGSRRRVLTEGSQPDWQRLP